MSAAKYVVMTIVHVYAHVGCNTCVFTSLLQHLCIYLFAATPVSLHVGCNSYVFTRFLLLVFSSALVGAVAKQQGSRE